MGFVLGCGESDPGDDVECIRDTDCEAGQICRNAYCVDEDDPCLANQGDLCPDGLTCGTYNWGELTLCLEDGQIPIDAPSCGIYGDWQVNTCLPGGQIPTDNESCNNVGEFCSQPNQVCADRFDGILACLEFCGLCPTDLECTFILVSDTSGIDLCMQDGNIPDTAPQCDPDDYSCPDRMLCVAVCSHGS